MADRYWVGGTASWDATAGTKWATTDGGPGGAAVPTSADNVYLTAASGTVTITVPASTTVNCLNFDCTGFTGTVTHGSNFSNISCYGNFKLSSTMTFNVGSNPTVNLRGTGSPLSKTVTTAGKSLYSLTFNGVGDTWTLQDAITCTSTLTLTAGELNTNGYTVTTTYFNSTDNNARTLSLGASSIVVQASNNFADGSSGILTVNAGTSTITLSAGSATFAGGGKVYYNLVFSDANSDKTITGSNTFNNISNRRGRSLKLEGNQVLNGQIISPDAAAGNSRLGVMSSVAGLTRTISFAAAPTTTDIDFTDIWATGAAAPISGTRFGDGGGNSGITFDAPKSVYWNLAAGGNWNANAWAASSGASPSTAYYPLPQDTAIIENTGLNTSATVTINAGIVLTTLDMSTRTNAMTLATGTQAWSLLGDFKGGVSVTYTGVSSLTFSGRGNTQYLNCNGRTLTCGVTLNNFGGELQLSSAFIQSTSSTPSFTVTSGTFRTMNYAMNCGAFTSNGTLPRAWYFGSSTVVMSHTTATPSLTNTNLTWDAGTSNITFATVGGNWPATSLPSGLSFYDVTIAGGNSLSTTSTIGLTNCTFNNLTFSSITTDGVRPWFFTGNFTVTGTLTFNNGGTEIRRTFYQSDTAGTRRTITAGAIAGGHCDFRDIAIAGAAAGTTISTAGDLGNNTGITFPAPKTVYWNLAGSQNWNATGWAASSGGSPALANFPLAQDTAVFNDAGAAGTVTIPALNYIVGTLDFSARTSAMTFTTSTTTLSVAGNLKLGSGVTWTSSAGAINFTSASVTHTITSSGCTVGCNITVNTVNDQVALADALTLDSARTLTVSTGTFDAVTYNVTAGAVNISGSSARTVKMGSGLWTLSSTGTVWAADTTTNLTLYKGTANILLSDTSATSRFVQPGDLAYNKLTIGGATGTSTTTLQNTSRTSQFTELASTKTVAHTIQFGQTATFNFGKITVTGTAGNVVSLVRQGGGGSAPAINILGACTTGLDYFSVGDLNFGNSPGEFYAGANSTNGGATGVFFTATPAPRNLYWVGGTGNWSDTAKWSLSSGGAGGEAVPTSQDSVTFDTLSNATLYTATVNAAARCAALTIGAPASGALTFAGSSQITVHGNLSIAASNVTRTFTGALIFSGSATGKTINTNGVSLASAITVNGIACGWTLAGALSTSSSLTVTNGAFDSAGYALTATSSLSSNNTYVRSISLGASTVTTNAVTFTTSTNLTFNAGTSQLNLSGNGTTTIDGGLTWYNVTYTGTLSANRTQTINGNNTFNTLSITTTANGTSRQTLSLGGNQTIGTLVGQLASGSATARVSIVSSSFGTQRSIALTTLTCTDVDFQDVALTGGPFSGTRLGNMGGNAGITFDTPKTVYWNLAGSQNWSATGWATTSTGSPAVNNFPLAQDTAVFTNAGAAGTVTVNAAWALPNLDMSGRTSAMTLAYSASASAYGDYKLGTGVTNTASANTVTFSGRNTQTILTNGVVFGQAVVINSPGGTVQFGDAFTLNSSRSFTLTRGTLDASIYSVTLPNFACAATSTTVLTMGSGLWTLVGTGTVWNITAASTALTLNNGSANITLSDTSTTARTFAGNGYSYNKLTIGGTTGISTTTITGNNTFTELASTKTVAHTIALGSTYQNVGAWTITGTAGNAVTLTGTSAAAPALLLKTGGGTVNVGYLTLNHVRAYPYTAAWYAGVNSICGGCYGWVFLSADGLRCLVLMSDGTIRELPVSPPLGAALRYASGTLTTAGASAPLVYDHTTKQVRQSVPADNVQTP